MSLSITNAKKLQILVFDNAPQFSTSAAVSIRCIAELEQYIQSQEVEEGSGDSYKVIVSYPPDLKVTCIKVVRECLGLSLKEAKDICEEYGLTFCVFFITNEKAVHFMQRLTEVGISSTTLEIIKPVSEVTIIPVSMFVHPYMGCSMELPKVADGWVKIDLNIKVPVSVFEPYKVTVEITPNKTIEATAIV